MSDVRKKKKIYDIAPNMEYKNTHLMKDCCLLPYIYAKKYGYELVIVTVKQGEYPYLKNMPEATMNFLEHRDNMIEWAELCKEYIRKHAIDIDILFCFGLYYTYMQIVPLYKKLNPDGKVVLKMDANAAWVDNMPFQDDLYRNMLSRCDFISCECKKIQKILSKKIPYKIEYIPNGLDYTMYPIQSDYKDKQNVLLYVGRVGEPDKQNEILLEAFSRASKNIPSWTLRMVGPIDSNFENYISDYYNNNTWLKERVIFTGNVVDKHTLYEEYRRAKVFTITSRREGFPNVFAEASAHGCYMICSDIDAAGEGTNWGKNGSVFSIGDVNELTKLLVDICNMPDEFFENNYYKMKEYAKYYYDYDNIVERMHYIINMDEEK